MSQRILFARAPRGYRAAKGAHIITLQRGLVEAGPVRPAIDGEFGPQTEAAVRAWQKARQQAETGAVSFDDWTGITNTPAPSLFLRCLSLTARFEGHGYTHCAGNFDDAYITWGIIGFTLKHGNLARVLKLIDPLVMQEAMGPAKTAELMGILDQPANKQRDWSNSISTGNKKARVRPDWDDAFTALGNTDSARQAQHQIAEEVYWARALQDLRTYGQMTERDAMMFFDTAVQNGGVDSSKGNAIRSALRRRQAQGADDKTRLGMIADCIADKSSSKYREDVRSRRKTIANGEGNVHGAQYLVETWGLAANTPITEDDLRVAPPAPPPPPPKPPEVVTAPPPPETPVTGESPADATPPADPAPPRGSDAPPPVAEAPPAEPPPVADAAPPVSDAPPVAETPPAEVAPSEPPVADAPPPEGEASPDAPAPDTPPEQR